MPAQALTPREEILDRALDLASEEGLEGLTIGRLAADLEMSKSGLFERFGSKQELQLATIDAAAQRFIEEIVVPSLAEPEGRPRLRALCERYIRHVERPTYPGGCFWASVSAEFDSRPGPVRDAVRARVEAWLELLAEQARSGRYEEPRQLAFELYALVQGANSAAQLFGDPEAFRRARAAVERLLA